MDRLDRRCARGCKRPARLRPASAGRHATRARIPAFPRRRGKESVAVVADSGQGSLPPQAGEGVQTREHHRPAPSPACGGGPGWGLRRWRPGGCGLSPPGSGTFASRLLRPPALQCAAMLKRLTLRDFAVVPESELEFGPGMTVISGETGAGKSLLVDALGFLSGLRADAGMVRHGAQRAELHAEFDPAEVPAALHW